MSRDLEISVRCFRMLDDDDHARADLVCAGIAGLRAEIDRLNELMKKTDNGSTLANVGFELMQQENERLRAALTELANMGGHVAPSVRRIALAALATTAAPESMTSGPAMGGGGVLLVQCPPVVGPSIPPAQTGTDAVTDECRGDGNAINDPFPAPHADAVVVTGGMVLALRDAIVRDAGGFHPSIQQCGDWLLAALGAAGKRNPHEGSTFGSWLEEENRIAEEWHRRNAEACRVDNQAPLPPKERERGEYG